MERTILPSEIKPDQERVFTHILDGALGVPIEFKKQPTSADIQPNQFGFFGNDLYIKLSSGLTLKLTGAPI